MTWIDAMNQRISTLEGSSQDLDRRVLILMKCVRLMVQAQSQDKDAVEAILESTGIHPDQWGGE